MTFSIKTTSSSNELKLSYAWSLFEGQIIGRPDGAMIQVGTTSVSGGAIIEAKVKIGGLPAICASEFKGAGAIAATVNCGCHDEYYSITLKHEYARLDAFLTRLLSFPTAKGYIFLTVRKNETIGKGKKHLNKLMKYVNSREFDKSRLTFAVNKSDFNSRRTRLIALLENAPPPECDKCETIKGRIFTKKSGEF